jgi:hypothetical protein
MKKFDRPMLGFLTHPEMQAVLDAPDPKSWAGRRDRALFSVLRALSSAGPADAVPSQPVNYAQFINAKHTVLDCVPLHTGVVNCT